MLITGILLFSGCFYFIGKYVYDAVTKIDGASVLKKKKKNEDARLVQDILICIENGDGKSAVDKINSLGPDFSSVRVLEYLRKELLRLVMIIFGLLERLDLVDQIPKCFIGVVMIQYL